VTEHITRPTLLVWGERGPDDPLEHAKRITSEVKDCKLATVPESGHYIQEEKAEMLAQIIRDYLQ
jgi:pimeloyl-ACP methyl ester carboxylesterase